MSELPSGTIKRSPEDFVVDEIPAYEPSGEGTHLYVRFRKRNLTTDEVVRAFARALGVERRDIGVAGLKDKVAVTTQWISLPIKEASRVEALTMPGVELLDVKLHGNKLKTGHLKGNRFTIVIRDVDKARLPDVERALERIKAEGVPNAFGVQRFGRDGDATERARAWLTGQARAPADPRQRRFQFSVLQSAIFNAVLAHRVEDGTWNIPIEGDLLKKEDTGGLFVCTDVQLDRERADRGELCPTGPILGDRMRQPEGKALELEQRIAAPFIEGVDLRRARSLGEGTRRAFRLRVTDLSHQMLDSSLHETFSSEAATYVCAMKVQFVLPKGAYATTVLSSAFSVSDAFGDTRADTQEESNE